MGDDVNLTLYAVRADGTEDYAGAFTYRYQNNPYSWQDAQAAGLTTQGSYHISRVYTELMWDEYPGSGFYSIQGNGLNVGVMGNSTTDLIEEMGNNGAFQYGSSYTFDLYAYDENYEEVYMDTFSFEYTY